MARRAPLVLLLSLLLVLPTPSWALKPFRTDPAGAAPSTSSPPAARLTKSPDKGIMASSFARDPASSAVMATGDCFKYHSPEERKARAEAMQPAFDKLPPLTLVLTGKPCSGKSTVGTMLARALRCVFISTGNLLRGEALAGTPLGEEASRYMEMGELAPLELLLPLLLRRLEQPDCRSRGVIVDGFPRNEEQAKALLENVGVDAVVALERSDELIRDFSLGRMQDSATGLIYHPRFCPPPPEAVPRLVWRTDDTEGVLDKRIEQYEADVRPMLAALAEGGVATKIPAGDRSELETFDEVAEFLVSVARRKAAEQPSFAAEAVDDGVIDERLEDISAFTHPLHRPRSRREAEQAPQQSLTQCLLDLTLKCNTKDLSKYLPVHAGKTHVGYVSLDVAQELQLLAAHDVTAVEVANDKVVIAPRQKTSAARTRAVGELVQGLVDSGVVPRRKVRGETVSVGKFDEAPPPKEVVFEVERGAAIFFGIPSCGVHLNLYVDAPEGPLMWIGRRSVAKPTYPSCLDQAVAGGVTDGEKPRETLLREAVEEASIPPPVAEGATAVGAVSYCSSTKYGLSSKFLYVYDLKVEESFTPFNGDGEVEEFVRMPAQEVLELVRSSPEQWKPNSVLVLADFAIRHGLLDSDDPAFLPLCHALKGAFAATGRSA